MRRIATAALGLALAAAPAAAATDQERLGRIFDGCARADARTCVGEVWTFADLGGDGRLGADEIIGFFNASAEWGGERMRTMASLASGADAAAARTRAVAVEAMARIGPLAAALLIGGFDRDRDGRISRAEFFREFSEEELVGLIVRAGDSLPEMLAGLVLRSLDKGGVGGKDVTNGLGGGNSQTKPR